MKIFRSAGPLLPVVGVFCVFLILPAARADAQAAELSGAVKAVRQAEKQTDDSEVKNTLGETAKALKRAEKLAAKGQAGPLLDELSTIRKTLVALLDQSGPAASSIEQAVGLIDDAIRTAGGYRTTSDTSLGLHTTTLASLRGTVRVYLPEDIRVGDTISGAVEVQPTGATPEERQRNGATLSGVVITLEEDETPASDGSVRWQVPAIETGTAMLVLRDPSGTEVGRATVPVDPVADEIFPSGPSLPEDYELPPIVQFGNPFTISGPFDGEFDTTSLDLDGELTVLAESPRSLFARAPIDPVGQHSMTLSEGDTVITREVNVIHLDLSAGKLDLLKGETTVVTAEVTGFADLHPEAYPIEFEMINHSPETVTMEGLEDNRFYTLIFPEDISTGEDLATAGSFVVESTLVGVRTGTFNISATVTSPLLFDILGPGQQPDCSEQKQYRLLCVRFIILDEPGAKDRKENPEGLRKDVKYRSQHVGEVSDAAIGKAKAALESANAIWLQCFPHCCWIRFELDTEDGRPGVFALDPGKKLVIEKKGPKVFKRPRYWDVKLKQTIDLKQFLDKSRDINFKTGNVEVDIEQEATWAQDVGSDIKKGDSAVEALREMARNAETQSGKKRYEQAAKSEFKAPRSILWLLGSLIDQELGKRCINIILVNSLDNTGTAADESGYASEPGRNLLLEEKELDSKPAAVLAHELGHNLGLPHVQDGSRLMNEGAAGRTLTEDECDTACKTAGRHPYLKPARRSSAEAKDRHNELDEERKKAEEEARKADEEREAREEAERKKEEEDERRQEELDEIDKRLGEIDRRMTELEKKITEAEKGFRKTVEEMKGQSEAEKQKILDDNLPSWAKKEKAELEELKKEKADLAEKKAGLQK
jgi:hypothetical protein